MKSCFLKVILCLKQEQMSSGYEMFSLADICSSFNRKLKFIISPRKRDLSYVIFLMYLDSIFRRKNIIRYYLQIISIIRYILSALSEGTVKVFFSYSSCWEHKFSSHFLQKLIKKLWISVTYFQTLKHCEYNSLCTLETFTY